MFNLLRAFLDAIPNIPPVYLHLIFEISSVTRFFFSISNSKKNQFWNKLNFLSSLNLIFTACVACKNQFRNQIDFLIWYFEIEKKIEWHSIFQKSSGDRQGDSHESDFIFLHIVAKPTSKNLKTSSNSGKTFYGIPTRNISWKGSLFDIYSNHKPWILRTSLVVLMVVPMTACQYCYRQEVHRMFLIQGCLQY